ncbi:MAG: Deoxyribose-phosphate aldolase [Microgenomates group bacterium GW2011_GWA2_44_7]|nr:MAG: Deoxyribose-phosphate aldolase [Microgenomates group bacterium GW2011_GWA2_44_7]KKT77809.1 MAG: Deoxyribose-phosphate aldolase [Microgenomates group bacterium GW2011_GWB1_44_8]
MDISSTNLASFLDLANHHANATPDDINSLCQKVIHYGFNSVFVNPYYVSLAKEVLGDKGRVGTVIAFPLGQERVDIKIAAIQKALTDNADELDISLNIGLIKAGLFEASAAEMRALVSQAKSFGKGKIVKFIIETGYLSVEEIAIISQHVLESGADFVKTTSGMGPRLPTIEDVEIIKRATNGQIKIKVAGGIETRSQAISFLEAGAVRIGTSHAVEIVQQPQTDIPSRLSATSE